MKSFDEMNGIVCEKCDFRFGRNCTFVETDIYLGEQAILLFCCVVAYVSGEVSGALMAIATFFGNGSVVSAYEVLIQIGSIEIHCDHGECAEPAQTE